MPLIQTSKYSYSNFQQVRDRPAKSVAFNSMKMDEELCASYLKLCLKVGEPPTQDEDFL